MEALRHWQKSGWKRLGGYYRGHQECIQRRRVSKKFRPKRRIRWDNIKIVTARRYSN